MSNERYSIEKAYRILGMSDETEGETLLTKSASEYKPVDSSETLTDISDDGEEVSAKGRRTRPHSQIAEVLQLHDDSHVQQSASTSAAQPFGELANTNGLVHPGLSNTSTAVSLGDVESPISAVQAGALASTSSVLQLPRIHTQAHRAPSVLPDVLANSDCQPTNSTAPVLPPFTAQPGIQVETANLTTPLDFFGAVFLQKICMH
ncbi:unnamed protein product [Staurois parvus]|uniref:Uncharacterized protein n=1 Tax=Staurois parvus TaxID=386267 RepID=A0ABN9FXQ9_9NEOB|nr:unnamed protein product [Staurois parvus]